MPYSLTIECDGACRRNGQPDAVGGAGISILLQSGERRNYHLQLPASPKPTNQRAELTAFVLAFEQAIKIRDNLRTSPHFILTLKTDSRDAVDVFTKWIDGWRQNSFVNARGFAVVNQDLIKEIDALWDNIHDDGGGTVNFVWIPREQNDEADRLANLACDDAEQTRDEEYY